MTEDKNDDFDLELEDDDFYDDVLEENFDSDDFDLELDDDVSDATIDDVEDDLGWDDEGDDTAQEEALGQKKESKLSGLNLSFNTIVILGAVILGVGVLAFQLMTATPPEVAQRFVSSLNMSGASDGPIFGDKKEEETQGANEQQVKSDEMKAFLFDPTVLDEMEDNQPSPKESITEENTVLLDDTSILTPMPTVVEKEFSPQNEVVDIISNTPIPREPEDNKSQNIDEKEDLLDSLVAFDKIDDMKPVPVLNEQAGNKNSEFIDADAFQDFVAIETVEPIESDSMKTVQEPMTNEIIDSSVSSVKEELLVDKQQDQTSEEELNLEEAPLKKEIDTLSSRLDSMEDQLATVRDTGSTQIQEISESIQVLKQAIKNKPVKKESSSSAPVTSKKSPAVKSRVKQAPVKQSVHKVSWELRAAQPGKAWVSEKGQGQMKAIVIGDTLNGIGRIIDISFVNNRWLVQGTMGKIVQ